MSDRRQQQRLLSLVLDGLDDLYDQRFGWPEHRRPNGPTTEIWLHRLLLAASGAFEGSPWEQELGRAADDVAQLLRSGVSGQDLNDQVLFATDALRDAVAAEVG